jgi:tRNA1(Val) A37 N6-methylase TrmN6
LHQLPTLTPALNSIDTTKGAVHFINAGIGVIPLLVALMHKEVEVYGYEEDITKYNISIETSALPANLHLRHTVWSAELAEIPADSVVYMIQYSPLSIKLNS